MSGKIFPATSLPIEAIEAIAAGGGNPLSAAVIGAIAKGLDKGLSRADVPVKNTDVAEVITKVLPEIAAQPEIQYAASTEPWYRSRSKWAQIISIATPILAIGGYSLSPESQSCLALLGTQAGPLVAGAIVVAGGAVSAWFSRGARRATRPLGL